MFLNEILRDSLTRFLARYIVADHLHNSLNDLPHFKIIG